MKIIFSKNNKLTSGGYTIIETMIAVSLFLIVVMSGMGAVLNANLLHQKSGDMRSIIDSMSFVMEDMSRNLRTGYNYRCISNITDLDSSNVSIPKSGSSCWGIAFESASGNNLDANDQWVYYIGTNGLNPAVRIFRSTVGPHNNSSIYTELTPDEISIDPASSFAVLGAEPLPGNSQQPFVNIKLVGQITFKNTTTPFSLQTSVSQRLLGI
jgi:Tfp pilus assembly protein PilW